MRGLEEEWFYHLWLENDDSVNIVLRQDLLNLVGWGIPQINCPQHRVNLGEGVYLFYNWLFGEFT